jgi:hypothetical protein
MLNPRERTLLLESLRPPAGYELDFAIGTTFTLDLIALLTAPLAFTLFDWEDREGRPAADPLTLLEALRRNASRILIFCQTGQIKVPPSNRPLLAHLEDSVVEVKTPHPAGVFHPKAWLLRFAAAGVPIRYRFLCLSRNLTFDQCWDTALALDGELVDRQRAIAVNHPLGEFVAALPSLARRPLAGALAQRVSDIADEVRRVRFELPEGFEEIRFHPLGIPDAGKWPFRGRIDRMLILSPFISEGCLSRLTSNGSDHVLVSRPDCLEGLSPAVFQGFKRVCILDESAESGEEMPGAVEVARDGALLSGLHAKLYVADRGRDASVWTGSANATEAAFGQNVELLVELTGRKSVCGIGAILGEAGEKPSFGDLLRDFPAPAEAPPSDEVAQQLEQRLEEARRAISGLALAATLRAESGTDQYALTLGAAESCTLPPDTSCRCWPVTLRADFARDLASGTPVNIDFGLVSFEALTAFFAFEVTTRVGQRTASDRFVLNVSLTGAPANRHERLLLAILSDRGSVLRFLLILLTAGGLDGSLGLLPPKAGDNGGGNFGLGHRTLFEALVRTLDRDAGRLDQIARLVDDLRHTAEGAALLPDGFDSVWAPIWAARQGLAR